MLYFKMSSGSAGCSEIVPHCILSLVYGVFCQSKSQPGHGCNAQRRGMHVPQQPSTCFAGTMRHLEADMTTWYNLSHTHSLLQIQILEVIGYASTCLPDSAIMLWRCNQVFDQAVFLSVASCLCCGRGFMKALLGYICRPTRPMLQSTLIKSHKDRS